jgi:uncharacterized protein YigE (DUF2233 family)
MSIRFVLMLAVVLQVGRAAAEPWKPIAAGVEYRVFAGGLGQALRVDLKRVRLTAVKAARSNTKKPEGATVEALSSGSKALFGINGGFFDPQFRSLGLLISGRKELNPIRKADWGILWTNAKTHRATLVHTKAWSSSMRRKAGFAIQAGPRLVVNGKIVKVKLQWGRRTAIGIQRDGRKLVIAVVAASMFLPTLAKHMLTTLSCPNALNLDGGGSTQLWAKIPRVRRISGEPVANGVLFSPR